MCVFRLCEFNQIMSDSNWDQSLTKNKIDCKEHKLDFINSCHVYAINKQLVSKKDTFKVVAACGKKLILFQLKTQQCTSQKMCPACSNASMMMDGNQINNNATGGSSSNGTSIKSSFSAQNLENLECSNDMSGLFQIKKEIICFEVPQIVNVVDTFNGESYIIVGYKAKCEIIDQNSGEYLHLFQLNPLSSIRSIVELYDNKQLEMLITHNCE